MSRRWKYIASGFCALLAAALCLAYGEQVRAQCERERTEALERYGGEVVRLVVATELIEAGDAIDGTNATERDWVAELAPEGALTSFDDAKGLKVSVPVAAGMPVTDLNLRDPEEAVEVPSGKMAITIATDDDTGVPPGLETGVTLAAYEVGAEGVRLVADDLKVLSAPAGTTGAVLSDQLTVAVSPEDVAPLLATSQDGSLRLVLPGEGVRVSEDQEINPDNVPPQLAPEEAARGGVDGAGSDEKDDGEGGGRS